MLVAREGLAAIGQSSASMEGRSNREVFPRALADSLDAHYRAALEGASFHLELPMADRWFDVHVRPVHGADGRVTAGFVSSVDVTERKFREVLDGPGGRGTGSPAPA